MAKMYYTIGELSEILGESTSALRYWANTFPSLIRPQRNSRGNRLFTPNDIEYFKKIIHLTKNEGMTLDGVKKALSRDNGKKAADRVKVLESLREMRAQLLEIRKSL